MARTWTVRLFGIALIITIVLAGFGNAVLYLWNNVMPSIFGLPAISYWQAVGLLCLSWIFFGSWRAFPRFPSHRHAHAGTGMNRSTQCAVREALDKE
jgi:hypothetical protein